MKLRVKVCCIAGVAEAQAAAAAGADALGLVSAMPSGPGVVADALIAQVVAAVRGQAVRTFLLTSSRWSMRCCWTAATRRWR